MVERRVRGRGASVVIHDQRILLRRVEVGGKTHPAVDHRAVGGSELPRLHFAESHIFCCLGQGIGHEARASVLQIEQICGTVSCERASVVGEPCGFLVSDAERAHGLHLGVECVDRSAFRIKAVEALQESVFSREVDSNGNPEGIGLSIWRFNIGAGSVEQNDSSHINPHTRTECFLTPDGTYDWSRQAGQRNFLHLDKK